MTEKDIVDRLSIFIDEIMNYVDGLVVLIHFDLVDYYFMMTNFRRMMEDISYRIRILEGALDLKLYPLPDGKVGEFLKQQIDILPCTYIQLFLIGDQFSFHYYSSVKNTEEHAINAIKKHIKSLKDKTVIEGIFLEKDPFEERKEK